MATSRASASGKADDRPTSAAAGLRAGELNLFDSTVVAVSSVAPAYSLAATIGFLFVAVAYAGPAVSVLAVMALGVPLVFVARYATHSDFFHRPAIAYDSIEPSPDSVTADLWKFGDC